MFKQLFYFCNPIFLDRQVRNPTNKKVFPNRRNKCVERLTTLLLTESILATFEDVYNIWQAAATMTRMIIKIQCRTILRGKFSIISDVQAWTSIVITVVRCMDAKNISLRIYRKKLHAFFFFLTFSEFELQFAKLTFPTS